MDSYSPQLFGVVRRTGEREPPIQGMRMKSEMKLSRAGVDLAKSLFHIQGVERHGQARWQKKLKRRESLDALCDVLAPNVEVAMEACGSAHHWGRELGRRGLRAG